MKSTFLPIYWGWTSSLLILLTLYSSSFDIIQCQIHASGSGAGDTLDSGDGEELGSGTIIPTNWKPSTNAPVKVTDDEDGDTTDDIDIIFSGDSNSESGSGDVPPSQVKCTESFLWCYCVDKDGNEIAGTRKYTDDPNFRLKTIQCPEEEVLTSPSTLIGSTETTSKDVVTIIEETTIKVEETTKKVETVAPVPSTAKHPYIVNENTKTHANIKFATTKSPREDKTPGEGADVNGIFGDDDDDGVLIEKRDERLFTHPGILAAIIGGGVVALLCALLLIMFVVYRMRKKDEGSYPLDPDAKPPRLHTYTRAPNKEFYA